MEYYITLTNIYKNQYIILKDRAVKKNGVWHSLVECPHCHQKRLVRKTILSPDNKQHPLSTLCALCSNKTKRLFSKDEDGLTFTIVNGYKVIVDEDIAIKLEYSNLVINDKSNDHPYVLIYEGAHRRGRNITKLHHYVLQCKSGVIVDHINHNTLDNRRENLRICSRRLNGINTKISIKNTTGFKNISICNREKKWFCQYVSDDKVKITKRFEYFLDAYRYLRDTYVNEYKYNILEDKNVELKYADILYDDIVNGDGVGATLFVQFCPHHCKGCQNPETWSKHGGQVFTLKSFENLMTYFETKPYVNHLSLSGGDPLANLELTNFIASEFKYRFPSKKIWIWTGYKYEDLIKDKKYWPILELCDVLVDGRYIDKLRDLTLKFRGSSNQRVIDVQKSLKAKEIVLWCD